MKVLGRIVFAAALICAAGSQRASATCASNIDVFDYSVTQTGSVWTYNYGVINGCAPNHQQLLTNFYVPYFSDAGISNITVPGPDANSVTWSYTIEANNNVFGLTGAGVIDFQVTSTTNVGQNENLTGVGYYGGNGFSFTSTYAPTEGPYGMLITNYDGGAYDTTTLLTGDPSIPASPNTVAALNGTAAPEPADAALLIAGVCLVLPAIKRRIRS